MTEHKPNARHEVRGDDEEIIKYMQGVNDRLNDRISKIRSTADTSGLDPTVQAMLERNMDVAQTHLTRGQTIANANIDAAYDRMKLSDAGTARVNSIGTNVAASPTGRLFGGGGGGYTSPTAAAMKKARPQFIPSQSPQMAAQPTMHTSSGSYTRVAPQPIQRFSSPQPVTRTQPTAFVPPQTVAPQSQLFDNAMRARQQAQAMQQAQTMQQAQRARQLIDAQNAAYNTQQMQRQRARNYLDAQQQMNQRAQLARQQQSQDEYQKRRAETRAQQQAAANSIREQTRAENAKYDDMLRDMERRSISDLPEVGDRHDTLSTFKEETPTLFDRPEDAGTLLPKEAYNNLVKEMLGEYETDPDAATQAADNLGLNKDELRDRIYDILKEEDDRREAEAMASQPGTYAGYPSDSVFPPASDTENDQAVAELATQYVNAQIPYAWGGGHGAQPGPSQGISDGGGYADACGDYNKIGLDCSGLSRDFTWNMYGVDINGTAASQYASGMPIAPEDARPGDIFFPFSSGRPPGHVTVYIGAGSMLEAQQSGTNVMISPLPDGEFRRFVQ